MLLLVCPVRGIKHVGLRSSQTKSRKRRACTCPSGTRNQVGGTTSIRYKVARKEGLYSSVRYEDFFLPGKGGRPSKYIKERKLYRQKARSTTTPNLSPKLKTRESQGISTVPTKMKTALGYSPSPTATTGRKQENKCKSIQNKP